MKLTEKLASEDHLTAEQVERIGRNVRDFMDAVERDPVLMKEASEKLGWGSAVKKLPANASFLQRAYAHAHDVSPALLGSAGLAAALGLGTDLGRTAIRNVKDSYNKSQAYKSMLEDNPQLANADPGLTEKAFGTLYRFNPGYAKDPLVAGTFVKNVIDQERMDIGTVSNLVAAHKAMSDSSRGGNSGVDFFSGLMPGADFPAKSEESRLKGGRDEEKFESSERRTEEKHKEQMKQLKQQRNP